MRGGSSAPRAAAVAKRERWIGGGRAPQPPPQPPRPLPLLGWCVCRRDPDGGRGRGARPPAMAPPRRWGTSTAEGGPRRLPPPPPPAAARPPPRGGRASTGPTRRRPPAVHGHGTRGPGLGASHPLGVREAFHDVLRPAAVRAPRARGVGREVVTRAIVQHQQQKKGGTAPVCLSLFGNPRRPEHGRRRPARAPSRLSPPLSPPPSPPALYDLAPPSPPRQNQPPGTWAAPCPPPARGC